MFWQDFFLFLSALSIGMTGLALAVAIQSHEEKPKLTFAAVAWYFSVMFMAAFIGFYI